MLLKETISITKGTWWNKFLFTFSKRKVFVCTMDLAWTILRTMKVLHKQCSFKSTVTLYMQLYMFPTSLLYLQWTIAILIGFITRKNSSTLFSMKTNNQSSSCFFHISILFLPFEEFLYHIGMEAVAMLPWQTKHHLHRHYLLIGVGIPLHMNAFPKRLSPSRWVIRLVMIALSEWMPAYRGFLEFLPSLKNRRALGCAELTASKRRGSP